MLEIKSQPLTWGGSKQRTALILLYIWIFWDQKFNCAIRGPLI